MQAMAQGMQFLILGWLILDITDSSYQLGLVIFAFGLPNLIFAMLGGIIADRTSRLNLLISTRLCVVLLILALAILKATSLLDVWHIYAIVVLLGTIQALNGAARMAIVADLVHRDHLMNAVALHSMVNQTGQIIGPAVAGGIIELVGIAPSLFVNAGFYLSGAVFLALIRGLPAQSGDNQSTVLSDLKAGLQSIRSTPILYTVIGMTLAFAFFAVSYRNVMPGFGTEVLGIGPGGSGLLLLAAGLGSLIGSLVLASLGEHRSKTKMLVIAVSSLSLFLVLFAWSQWFWVSWVILLFVGAASFGFFTPLATTLIQLNVKPELRGRVLSIFQLAPALHYLGGLPLAATASIFSWPIALTGSAIMSLVVAIWLSTWKGTLRDYEAGLRENTAS